MKAIRLMLPVAGTLVTLTATGSLLPPPTVAVGEAEANGTGRGGASASKPNIIYIMCDDLSPTISTASPSFPRSRDTAASESTTTSIGSSTKPICLVCGRATGNSL